jgi:ammonium transporter, Amt family
VGGNDIVARLGGDEFTIILKNTNEEQAGAIASQIGAALRDFTFSAGDHDFRVHCSIGITLIDSSPTTTTELLSEADTACHEAKDQGRNCFKFFREIAPEEILHLEGKGLKEQIQRALDEERLSLSFLPVKNWTADRITAFEILVQMGSKDQEVPARAFFLAAERFDLAPRIDRWVIGQALLQLRSCNDDRLAISINLSARTLQQDDIIAHIRDRLAENQLDPARVSFEIPERAVLKSVTQTKNFMEKLREIGCGLIIDDFGVSLNSINLLKHLPVNQLKLEAGLVSSVRTSTFNQAVIASIVRIAQELGIEVVAKGVVRGEEVQTLRSLGVHYLQGQEVGQPLRELPGSAPDFQLRNPAQDVA